MVFGSFTVSGLQAQSGCWPCPPECCITTCCTPSKGAAASSTSTGEAALMAFSSEEMAAACGGKKMSKKEIKACMAACTSAQMAATPDENHVAPLQQKAVITDTPCQPVCVSSDKEKKTRKSDNVQEFPAGS